MKVNNTQKQLQQGWDLIITPQRKWWDLRLDELWQYRDMVLLFVRRNYVSVYKQTILGPLWHFITPLFSSAIFTIIFGNLAGLPTDDIPPFLFYLSGNVIWNYFSGCFSGTSNTFVANQGIFGKVYFPRLVIPISVVLSNLVSFGIRFLLFLGFLVYFVLAGYPVHPGWWALLTPFLLLMMAGIGLGWGIIISGLTTKYRDLQVLVGFGLQFLMYATPIIYPASMVPEQYKTLYFLNPIAPVVEAFRFAFLGAGTVDFYKLGYSFIFMVVTLLIGLMIFNKVEANFMDTV